MAGSDYIDSDAVFAVKETLITDFERVDGAAEAARYGVTSPFRHADIQIALQPA